MKDILASTVIVKIEKKRKEKEVYNGTKFLNLKELGIQNLETVVKERENSLLSEIETVCFNT